MEDILDNNLQDDAAGNWQNNNRNKPTKETDEERETEALKRWESFATAVNNGSLAVDK